MQGVRRYVTLFKSPFADSSLSEKENNALRVSFLLAVPPPPPEVQPLEGLQGTNLANSCFLQQLCKQLFMQATIVFRGPVSLCTNLCKVLQSKLCLDPRVPGGELCDVLGNVVRGCVNFLLGSYIHQELI